jgi:hypothetical protein
MIAALGAHQDGLQGQQHVDQFHYMQKLEELAQLENSISETLERLKFLQNRFDSEYEEVFCRWRKDVRWMNKLMIRSKGRTFSSADEGR